MPTYEYVCTECQNHWEEVQKISEPALEDCPKCGKKTAKRQISGGNFILKGGGWYADLYSSTSKKSGGSEAPAGNKTEASKPAATETSTTPAASTGGATGSTGSTGSGGTGGTKT